MQYGLTPYGFIQKRGDQLLTEIRSALSAAFPNIDLSDDSVVNQLVGILADPFADLWSLAGAVYNSQYPNSAEGQPLDFLCELNAITRLKQTASTSVLAAKGTEGTLIDTTFKVGVANNSSVIFQATQPTTITVASTNKMTLQVTTVTSNATYTITINSHTVSINSGVGATAISIALALNNEINTLTSIVGVSSILPSPQDGTFTIISNNTDEAFTAIPDSNSTVTEFWTPVPTTCLTLGAISVNASEITNIITPVAGLNSVANLKDAITGTDIENDTQLRLRRYNNVRVVGAATVEAIRARLLQQVADVTQALVYENITDSTDIYNRPPHSIECLVAGGTDQDIANKIWQVKGAGIATYGNQSETVFDSMGFLHTVYFSRPVNAYIWVQITLTVNNAIFPANGAAQITDAMLEVAAANFNIGNDVLIQQLFCPIYNAVPGVILAVLELAKTYDLVPPSVYVQTNVAIGEDEVAVFDSSRIAITIP